MFDTIITQLRNMQGTPARLKRDDFDLGSAESGSRSLIASFQAPNPLVLRQDRPLRLAIPAFETFTSAGQAGAQTFELSHDLLESPQSRDLLVFADGSKVSPGSVDYGANSFEYTDGGNAQDLAAYYISGADCPLEIEKQAPSTHGSVSERIFEEPMELMHQRDQDEEPRHFEIGETELMRVVPKDWRVNVYADPEYEINFADDATGTRARNAIISLPYVQGSQDLEGLARAVAHDIINRA